MDTNHHSGRTMPYGEPRMSSCKNIKIIKCITVIMTCGNETFYCTLFVNKLLLLLLLLLMIPLIVIIAT